ncbi:hypothetical protein [Lysobacter sp. CA196]|uniref:hypothetical protein n=1 Tax=Lysobacter sp. CA196 TaxID=3455606 RepID=UPI003F8D5F37
MSPFFDDELFDGAVMLCAEVQRRCAADGRGPAGETLRCQERTLAAVAWPVAVGRLGMGVAVSRFLVLLLLGLRELLLLRRVALRLAQMIASALRVVPLMFGVSHDGRLIVYPYRYRSGLVRLIPTLSHGLLTSGRSGRRLVSPQRNIGTRRLHDSAWMPNAARPCRRPMNRSCVASRSDYQDAAPRFSLRARIA